MTDSELERLLALSDPAAIAALYDDAYRVKMECIGKCVSIRGLIEISNICRKNCYYCGIRSGNGKVARFRISREEILETALWAHRHRFASLVLQSGEVASEAFTSFIEEIVRELTRYYNVDIRFQDDGLRQMRFSGDFQVEDGIYHIMSVLQLTYKFNYRIVGNDIEIYTNTDL